jgi:hypothetical protein
VGEKSDVEGLELHPPKYGRFMNRPFVGGMNPLPREPIVIWAILCASRSVRPAVLREDEAQYPLTDLFCGVPVAVVSVWQMGVFVVLPAVLMGV